MLSYWCLLEAAISHPRCSVHRYEKIQVSTAVEAKVNGHIQYNQFRRYINHSIMVQTVQEVH